jgi:hypothetical protein
MAMKKVEKEQILEFSILERGEIEVFLIGTSPILLNRLSEKARHELLLPKGRKTETEKKTSLKHDPLEEYRASCYRDKDPKGPTEIQLVACSIKHAMASVALDMPTSLEKTKLERLITAPEERIALYGVPMLHMDAVKQSGKTRAPDIRTRAIIPHWACHLRIQYLMPILNEKETVKLLQLAGFIRGIGEKRPGKGAGNFGTWEAVKSSDPKYLAIMKNGGRKAQLAALETPDFYDQESRELFEWYNETTKARNISRGNGKDKGAAMEATI